jgi:hypothetical protein
MDLFYKEPVNLIQSVRSRDIKIMRAPIAADPKSARSPRAVWAVFDLLLDSDKNAEALKR